jgi:hypothetical protein
MWAPGLVRDEIGLETRQRIEIAILARPLRRAVG